MNADEAKTFILTHAHLDRADIESAKHVLHGKTGLIELSEFARERAAQVAGQPDRHIPLWQEDPTPSLMVWAKYIVAHLAIFEASWDLIRDGVLRPASAVTKWVPSVTWTTAGPGRGGSTVGFDLQELAAFHVQQIYRPPWRLDDSVLASADLYTLDLASTTLHPQIIEALRQAQACFAAALYLPALAMLDAASEGAWLEAGAALVAKLGDDPAALRLQTTLDSPRDSVRTKCAAVIDAYTARKDFQRATGVTPAQLQDTLQWSGLIRDARNVLHWNVDPVIPAEYATVAVQLLAAVTHLRRLEHLNDLP